MEHGFTAKIKDILFLEFKDKAEEIYNSSQLLQYINKKTRSANKGSKSRSSFANLYAIYVLVENYIEKGFNKNDNYSSFLGATYTTLLERQRRLPFGSKLQNHALNSRMNEEFKTNFPLSEFIPILRNPETNKYWFNENLLKVTVSSFVYNISEAVIKIINEYIDVKMASFESFIKSCEKLKVISETVKNGEQLDEIELFIVGLLSPSTDARLFEIVSYSILKYYYSDQIIYFGFDIDKLEMENLKLYKTGRTNANDGGIDFVMKPLGRFFQVTETLDFKKYFLDIDKIERYPVTFVIKSDEDLPSLEQKIKEDALKLYSITTIVEKYMACIEEIINIPILKLRFRDAITLNYLPKILHEIIIQSKVEFNYEDLGNEEQDDE